MNSLLKKVHNGNARRKGMPRFVSEDFGKLLDEIKEMRIKIGKDDIGSIKADWRLTLAMVRHPLFIKLKEDIINSDLP